jgi:hypothetical protein
MDLTKKEIVIKKVLARGLASSVSVRSDGLSNLAKLNQSLIGAPGNTNKRETKPAVAFDGSASAIKLPAIRFQQIRFEDGSFHYRGEVLAEEALVFPLNNIQIEIDQLHVMGEKGNVEPTIASVAFELGQPRGLPTAYFGGLAAIGPVGSGVPLINSQLRLTGLKLDTLGSLIPPATQTAMGAAGIDADLTLTLDTERIRLETTIVSDQNIHYEALKVQGPLATPEVEMGPVLAGVFSHISEGLVSVGKSGLDAGVKVAEGGVDAAKQAGAGTIKVGKHYGKSFAHFWAGLVTLDERRMEKGLLGTTKDTLDQTVDSIIDTGAAAGGGMQRSVSGLTGQAMLRSWDEGIRVRHQEAMQQAQDALAKMPYPPVTESKPER